MDSLDKYLNKVSLNSRVPYYNDDSNYTTNAPSYYDDLARKTKLIEHLALRIWDYDKELAKRFAEWDKNLEEFDDEVLRLLKEWMDDGTFSEIINEVIFEDLNDKIENVAKDPKRFGIIGDGIADDTIAFQQLLDESNGGVIRLNTDDVYRITDQLTLPENIKFIGSGKFLCDGDVDFWLYALNHDSIEFEYLNGEVIKSGTERTAFNRFLRCEYGQFLRVDYANITGATTAIHNLFGDTFVGGIIRMDDVYGWEGTDYKEGYGVVSSAVHTNINEIHFNNPNPDMGRHSFYMNGDTWETCIVDYIYTKNCKIFPVSIVHSGTVDATLDINRMTFINCNTGSSAASNGSINFSLHTNPNLSANIGKIDVSNTAGSALSSQASLKTLSVDEVIMERLQVAFNNNTHTVYIRNAVTAVINKVTIDSLNNGWLSGVYLRETPDTTIGDVFVGGNDGSQAVGLLDSNALIGTIRTTEIPRISTTNSNILYKAFPNPIEMVALPPDRPSVRGEITFNRSPSQKDPIGWVCIADGNPGTWLEFGRIDRNPTLTTYGNSSLRPSASEMRETDTGFMYYDTALRKPLYWHSYDGVWRDALGEEIT